MVRLSKCCCCISVKTGAYAIGLLHVLGLLVGALKLDPLLIALEIFCGCSFMLMVYKDNKMKRLFYFVAYCLYVVFSNLIRAVAAIWDPSRAIKNCKDVSDMISTGKL